MSAIQRTNYNCDLFIEPYKYGIINLQNSWKGKRVDVIGKEYDTLSLVERISSFVIGLLLMIPLINSAVFAILKTTDLLGKEEAQIKLLNPRETRTREAARDLLDSLMAYDGYPAHRRLSEYPELNALKDPLLDLTRLQRYPEQYEAGLLVAMGFFREARRLIDTNAGLCNTLRLLEAGQENRELIPLVREIIRFIEALQIPPA